MLTKKELKRIKRLARDGDDLCKRTGVSFSFTVTDQDALTLIAEIERLWSE
jgi:hypothetical protein